MELTEGTGVLVVDDQEPFRTVARLLVPMLPGRVLGEAVSGEAGVELAGRLRPDLVLMDVNLPGLSGPEATRHIVARNPGTTVVLLSTYAREDLPADVLGCGAAGYVRKDELTPQVLRALLALRDVR